MSNVLGVLEALSGLGATSRVVTIGYPPWLFRAPIALRGPFRE